VREGRAEKRSFHLRSKWEGNIGRERLTWDLKLGIEGGRREWQYGKKYEWKKKKTKTYVGGKGLQKPSNISLPLPNTGRKRSGGQREGN